jgi:hypothetical protein
MVLRLRIHRFNRRLHRLYEFLQNVRFFKFQMGHPLHRAIELARNVVS